MSDVKMTDILVSTPAFIVTLTVPAKSAKNQEMPALVEVIPIAQASLKGEVWSEQFFAVLTADSSEYNRREKTRKLDEFVASSNKKMFEQFWDSANWTPLEPLCFHLPYLSCVLYDKSGNVKQSVICLTVEVWRALQRVEEAYFRQSLPTRGKKVPWAIEVEAKKEFRKDLNRATHKYFRHHRAPR